MTDLRSRLARATTTDSTTNDADTNDANESMVVPYDCIRDYLEGQRVVQLSKVCSRDLHSAILYVERKLRHPAVVETEDPPPPTLVPPECVECNKGYYLVDAVNGNHVCSHCGVVPNRASLNITREWIDGVRDEDLAPRSKRSRHVPGVPEWMVKKNSANPRAAYEQRALEDLENMNGYMHVNPDVVRLAHQNFLRWTENGYSREVKMLACLFHPILRSQFLTETDVRSMVRVRSSIPQVEDPIPKPTFPCRCGMLHHTKKGARYHSCRHGPSVSSM